MESASRAQAFDSEQPGVYELAAQKLLPATCPECGAPGTRAQGLGVVGSSAAQAEGLDAFYCDLCADSLSTWTTRKIALFSASAIVTVSFATAAALALGTRSLVIQVVLTLGLSITLPFVLKKLGVWPQARRTLWVESIRGKAHLFCTNEKFGATLIEHGFRRVPGAEAPLRGPSFGDSNMVGLALIGGVWLLVVHSLGGAQVRVLVSGTEPAVLLVDARHAGIVAPSNEEDPRAGLSARILGGRRNLQLMSTSGLLLGGEKKTIWPGRTYIVGHLPPGSCLFWERRTYGGPGRSVFFPVGGEGPVWELRDPVDSWFLPLSGRETDRVDSEGNWESTGGLRRAIRLLPCRGGGQL